MDLGWGQVATYILVGGGTLQRRTRQAEHGTDCALVFGDLDSWTSILEKCELVVSVRDNGAYWISANWVYELRKTEPAPPPVAMGSQSGPAMQPCELERPGMWVDSDMR